MNEILPEVPARLSVVFRVGKLVEFRCIEFHRPDDLDVRQHGIAQEATLTCPSLHHQCEGGQCRGARINFCSVQVVGEDLRGNLRGRVALLLIDGVEKIEGVGKHMT